MRGGGLGRAIFAIAAVILSTAYFVTVLFDTEIANQIACFGFGLFSMRVVVEWWNGHK